jgi:hypothetical protein
MEHTHKVQKYALIHSAAGEILAHMDELQTCSDSNSYFHVLQIEKAALFIQFVEDIYIIPGSEVYNDYTIKSMWMHVLDPKSVYVFMDLSSIHMQSLKAKLDIYQQKINGKFMTISPF